MSKKNPSRDEALEAIDFIVNVLKEHEKDLDRLIGELGTMTEKMGDTNELSAKVEKVEEKLGTLQEEISNLIGYLSAQPVAEQTPMPKSSFHEVETSVQETHGPPVIMRCKQWEDFLNLAKGAQTVSFLYREAEKTFQADALNKGQIVTFSGELPKATVFLKTWLAQQLCVSEKRILEGVLAIG